MDPNYNLGVLLSYYYENNSINMMYVRLSWGKASFKLLDNLNINISVGNIILS